MVGQWHLSKKDFALIHSRVCSKVWFCDLQVMQSWRLILAGGGMNIALEQVQIHVVDNLAVVTCLEVMRSSNAMGRCSYLSASNISNCTLYMSAKFRSQK